ncbi:hypothetical protein MKX07_005606 [Trichoderma sp. CBMAI-0711]|nr:hypothetical protein MKX07_005606 [Trichoderma sp. CBMAI-0711]
MDAGPVGPREPEQADRDQDGAKNGGRQTGFRRSNTIRRLGGRSNVSVVVEDGSDGGQGHANGNADEGQAANTGAPATALLEDNGKGGKAHVESAVDDGHVERDEKDDRLFDEEQPGSQEGNTKLAANSLGWLSLLELGDVDLASLLAQSSSALTEQDGSICLGVGQGAGNPDHTSEDGDQSLYPSPALGLAEEAACNRA